MCKRNNNTWFHGGWCHVNKKKKKMHVLQLLLPTNLNNHMNKILMVNNNNRPI